MCTYLVETCLQAKNHPGMAFRLFTGWQPHECLEWIPIGSFSKDHSVTNDNWRFAARLEKGGNNFGGFYFEVRKICFTDGDDGEPVRSDGGSPCQYLRVRDGCTVYYVDYEIGSPVPPNAVMSGYTTTGVPIYLCGHRNIGRLLGYYKAGSNKWGCYSESFTGNMMLLVLI